MKDSSSLDYIKGSNEEFLPLDSDFPYICQKVFLNEHPQGYIPWHFHEAMELFYVEKGAMVYQSSNCQITFDEGDCGFVNSSILHFARPLDQNRSTVFLLHSFNPSFLCNADSLIYTKYLSKIINSSFEIIRFDKEKDREIIQKLIDSFSIGEDFYELKLRNIISELVTAFMEKYRFEEKSTSVSDQKIKDMMAYVYNNYSSKITVGDLAKTGCCSERECYRSFDKALKMSPNDFINYYRLNKAVELLITTQMSISDICFECGYNHESYFGKQFKSKYGCSPRQYRALWQNSYSISRK